jgi:branched-subunit amino acid transport protein AzlD
MVFLSGQAMKIVVAVAFVLIIGSLASALFFLMRDKGRSNRTVQALAMRVGLSITLFLLVLFCYKMGWIQPTGLH